MNKGGAVALVIDSLEIDDQLARIMLGVREDFGTKEGEDVIRYHRDGLVLEVRVVDAKVGIEPFDLVGNELARNETLVRWTRSGDGHGYR